MALGGNSLQPTGCSGGCRAHCEGLRIKGEQIRSMSPMHQKQMEKLSDCFNLTEFKQLNLQSFQNESELFGRTIRVNLAKPMRIKEGSSRPGEWRPPPIPIMSSGVALGAFLSLLHGSRC